MINIGWEGFQEAVGVTVTASHERRGAGPVPRVLEASPLAWLQHRM